MAAIRELQLAGKRAERKAALDYVASREAEASDETADLRNLERDLDSILMRAHTRPLDFAALKVKAELPALSTFGADIPIQPPELVMPPPIAFWRKLFPGLVDQYNREVSETTEKHDLALASHAELERQREGRLAKFKEAHRLECEAAEAAAAKTNADVDALEAAYAALEHGAVTDYFTMVFEADTLPHKLPDAVRVAYDPGSKQLVIERQLPTLACIPADVSYKYVKKTDKIEAAARKPAERREMYADVLAKVALRSLRVALGADSANAFEVVAFNGYVDTVDPKNGQNVRPTLISVSTTRRELENIAFDRVDATACLIGLKALVSRSAHELQAVRPLVTFNMVDKRFIDKTDVLSQLDSRPNLAELTPSEFESLMTNLFEKMGLETKLTQASRDGGVDCVAWDMRPVIGGKVVIQAKRYKNTVGVSAIRDLYGTMMNEGAAKGILVTTSGYGPSTYAFAKDKPLELITGGNLLSLLSEHAGIEAKIDFPNEWIDAKPSGDEIDPP